ncbi:MAG: hypothetical protein BGP24_21390 [Lysobacterales bacterium 69-70]|nr:serine/threonine protein kinase [Xanthomonadaceae bacterium]ODU36328.1 MAG: hypothetical protein ABS97_00110 [Xanthomonadaceae bacterium SCN 69-320]ODV21675.1 MAG: hypothetical protein ABT27_03765 [Xanthomonadaceae bacterium SCN 69-25]OJY95876.1 MAG: hypothetical protein BGP24_21390 [Xanthomonadales bacterium 69-70]
MSGARGGTVSSADVQRWFAELVELEPAAASAQLDALAAADAALAARLRDLLAADAAFSDGDAPTGRMPAGLRALHRRDDDWQGRRVGRWRLLDCVGSGGMGAVYRAVATDADGVTVALKLLRADRDDAALRRRFVLERKVLQSLRHPGIAALVDAGETADGTPYVAMEFVDGRHLFAHADHDRLDLPARSGLLLRICAAVAHAHARQVVHRDIKNSNVLVTAQGQPKLLDFGIAKPLQAQFGSEYLERTATAQRFFSAASAAPEQLTGAATGPACDIYALGALLYELLCGEPPLSLHGLSAGQAEIAILQQEPLLPSQRLLALPAHVANARARQRGMPDRNALAACLRGDFDRIAAKALRKDPARRQASAEQFAEELRAAGRGDAATAGVWTRLQRYVGAHPRRAAAALGGIALTAVVAAWQSRHEATPPDAAAAAAVEEPAAAAPAATVADTDAQAPIQRLLNQAERELQRRDEAAALRLLDQAGALLEAAGRPHELQLQALSLRAVAATRSGDFPLAAQALDQAEAMATDTTARAALALLRARLLAARGREAEAAALLREVASATLPRLPADDPLAAQIRQQLATLDATAGPLPERSRAAADAAAPADTLPDPRLAQQLDRLARNLAAARAEAGIDTGDGTAPSVQLSRATAAASTPPASASPSATESESAAAQLAEEVARGCALNLRGDYAAALQRLELALEQVRGDPLLRHGDDYRLGTLALALARYGAAPDAALAEQLRHELARDAWLVGADARRRWGEQAAVALKLGVTPAS